MHSFHNSYELNIYYTCSVFTHLTKSVTVKKGGSSESRAEELQVHFPDFIWLLRNVMYLPEDDEGREVPLETHIHSEVASSTEQSRLVMQTLESVFPSLEYHYIPAPSADPAHTADLDTHWEELEEEFREKMEEIEQYLKNRVKTKLSFDRTRPVTGTEVAALLRDYVQAINTPNSLPCLESSWVSVMKLRFEAISTELVERYTREMNERTAGVMPMEEITEESGSVSLMQLHWSVFDECFGELRHRIETLLPHHISDELSKYSENLLLNFALTIAEFSKDDLLTTETPTGGLLLRFVQKNYALSVEVCETLWDQLFEESGIRNKAIRALNRSKAVDLNTDMALVVEGYMANAVGPAKLKVLEHKKATRSVDDLLRNVPGPAVNVRTVGGDRDTQKIRWDPPAINPGAADWYIVQTWTVEGWKDMATTDKCWVIVSQRNRWKDPVYRVISWNEREHNSGMMEEPLIVARHKASSVGQRVSYV